MRYFVHLSLALLTTTTPALAQSPTISSVTPNSVVAGSPVTVTITGNNFTSGSEVLIGGSPGSFSDFPTVIANTLCSGSDCPITVISNTQLKLTTTFTTTGTTPLRIENGTTAISNVVNITVADKGSVATNSFNIPDRGGTSTQTTGTDASAATGYGIIQPDAGKTTPSGIAIFGYRPSGVLVSETGVPSAAELTQGRIYAEINGPLNTGIAIANPNPSIATIQFLYTDTAGNKVGTGSTTVPPNAQLSQFLTDAPLNVFPGTAFQGTFSFTSSVPVAVVALRILTNSRNEGLLSTLPVIDTTPIAGTTPVVIPHFADGQGWTTQILLVNPSDSAMNGTIQFSDPSGKPLNLTIGLQTDSSFAYAIPPRSSRRLATVGSSPVMTTGSIRVVPAKGNSTPVPQVVFSFTENGITVTEAGVPVASGTAFRMYAENGGAPGKPGNIQTGLAIANGSSSSASVSLDITDLTGAPVAGIGPVSVTLPGSGQTSKMLYDLFPSLPATFKGVLRVNGTSTSLSAVSLRIHVNERGDYLITTTPPTAETASPPAGAMYFPQVADGGGFTTQFILFSGTTEQTSSGTLNFVKKDGAPLSLVLK